MDEALRQEFSKWARALTASVFLVTAAVASAAAGETEISKTVPPTSAPPAASAQTPAPPAPAAPAVSAQPKAGVQGNPIGTGASQPSDEAHPATASAPSPATPVTADEARIVEKVNTYFNGMTDLQGTFVQTDPDAKVKHGKFYFEKPGKVRFDYGAPSKLRIISDGKYIAIEDHDLGTSDRYSLEVTPFRLLLADKVDLAQDAKILGIDQSDDTVIVTLADKKDESSGRIRLFFNKADMSLKAWIITDAQGLDTRIEVANLEQNKQAAADLFQFSKDIGFEKLNQ
jgi:outer membrane lipoprotein-sorting protein